MNLDTNFKDDILKTSVNQKRKYQMIHNTDGTVSFEDVTAYLQTGSEFGAKEVNDERTAINKINSDRIVSLDDIDLVTEPGFFVDAMAVRELNSKLTEINSTGTTEAQLVYRFPNGLQICCSGVGTNNMTPHAASGGFSFDFKFNKPFSKVPRIFPSIHYLQGYGNTVAYGDATTTGFTALSKLKAANLDYMWVAIGRWK